MFGEFNHLRYLEALLDNGAMKQLTYVQLLIRSSC
jgi:hypothetical protein